MWHSFILITKDYADFCHKYFGAFLHHVPEVGDDVEDAPEVDLKQFERELSLFLSFTYDHLGEPTVRCWFAAYI